ncbi:MAG: ABC transporter permease [Bryobacteraceae bacterium]|nr:ABC transporter permease [Bryobacteraceae bacterium]
MKVVVYRFTTALGLALDSLRAHKLRSFLTLLGVIIGVASVVLVGAAIEGLGLYAEQSTAKAFGTDSYMIAQLAQVGRLTRKERADKLRYNKPIELDDLQYLRIATGEQILYSPYRVRSADVKRDDVTFEDASVLGVAASLPEIRDVTLVEGRFFTEPEENTRQQVAVIGQDIVAELFPSTSPLGRTIRVKGLDFTIIGIQEKLGSVQGRSQDNSVYLPSTVFTRLFGPDRSMAVFGRPRPETGLTLDAGLDVTRAALRTRFKTKPGKDDNFDTLTPDAIRSFVDSILGLISAVVVPVTMISLVVGGIVIMNIMLVSVTERTREIGVRKSLGARRADLLLQFLVESIMLSLLGGIIGLTIGAAFAQLLSLAFDAPLRITFPYVFLAIFVSSAVGILSGWYPANRASKLDPVVALRAE